jgi:hypothetical protein
MRVLAVDGNTIMTLIELHFNINADLGESNQEI